MAHELEAAQVDAASGWFRFRRHPHHAAPPGTPCANCATELLGPWCHACGQLGEDFHRSWFRLIGESIEGVFHFDGRVWRTLPDLVLRPGRLTRQYLEGHRAPQVPPLRLFLVVLLLLFFVGSIVGGSTPLLQSDAAAGATAPSAKPGLNVRVSGTTPAQREAANPGFDATKTGGLTAADRAKLKAQLAGLKVGVGGEYDPVATDWLRDRLGRLLDRPEEFKLLLEAWSERFAFLMLPISALLLGVLFVFQRRFYIFDHLIFSMHSLSFLGVAITLFMALQPLVHAWAGWLIVATPVHLFVHMRGVYKTSVIGTLLRMFLLFAGSLVAFVMLMLGLLLVGLAGLSG
jgi:hypothetical protein